VALVTLAACASADRFGGDLDLAYTTIATVLARSFLTKSRQKIANAVE
jgi:hypothetical protein